MNSIVPVILSGGSGTRLWPVSTGAAPKQFQPLTGSESMFRQTLDRVSDRTRFAATLIVCGPGHVDHVETDLAAEQRDFPHGDGGDGEHFLLLERRCDGLRRLRRNALGIGYPPDERVRVEENHGGSKSQSASPTDAVGSAYASTVPRRDASTASGSP